MTDAEKMEEPVNFLWHSNPKQESCEDFPSRLLGMYLCSHELSFSSDMKVNHTRKK